MLHDGFSKMENQPAEQFDEKVINLVNDCLRFLGEMSTEDRHLFFVKIKEGLLFMHEEDLCREAEKLKQQQVRFQSISALEY